MKARVSIVKFGVVTLFPEMFASLTNFGVTGRAVKNGVIEVLFSNPRDFTHDRHRTVDDRPYGGGPGMVMMAEPLVTAINAMKAEVSSDAEVAPKVIYLSPQGKRFDQNAARAFSQSSGLVLVAGRYEGIDERVIRSAVDEEWSLGDYVLSGGELPAMVMIDAIARLLPDVLGHLDSAEEDSFTDGLLDCPHYTRPESYQGQRVPDVLLSGNHKAIRQWRLKQALGKTWKKRPDLLNDKVLDDEQKALLDLYRKEHPLN